jgi:RNA polymerase sigma-70 factor (ECF subfamily)
MGNSTCCLTRLIERAHREPAVLDRLLDSYRNYLRLLARSGMGDVLRGKADPSDLVQEALLKAHLHFSQFRGQTEGELIAWLRKILARNLADLARRYCTAEGRQVGRERSLEELLDQSSAALAQLVARDDSSPSEAAQRNELTVVLADALAELDPDYRDVLTLRSIEERDWDDVAGRMNRSPGAVRLLWARALKRLRPLIEARI